MIYDLIVKVISRWIGYTKVYKKIWESVKNMI